MKARVLIAFLSFAAVLSACPATKRPPEGLDPSKLPDDVRISYEVFAQRCSKCHSLSRPLESGIDDDEYWKTYVEKMRRMPSSGISPSDAEIILAFLHWYSTDQRAQKKARQGGP